MPRSGPIIVLTGAGISKEFGLHTFRDPDGIWAQHRIEEVATPEAFARDPKRVHTFYNTRRHQLVTGNIQPNAAHEALPRLERDWPHPVLIVTQNIDDLHERAGSVALLHMHGELRKSRCQHCGDVRAFDGDLDTSQTCRSCGMRGGLRPHVVWFGEMPLYMDEIGEALATCALFVSIGTSGHVYPAAGFVQEARHGAGAHTVELNLEPSLGENLFAEKIYGPASQIVPAFVEGLLSGSSKNSGAHFSGTPNSRKIG
ncbi:MAG: NAD-dependent protein deacylase [Alphaproteobacteria bacterium]|nr:NAD-dependent protein deacylase [Alphaproteobacteria bacterium]